MSQAIPTDTIASLSSTSDMRASPGDTNDAAVRILLDGETRWDKRLIAASDWLNPILVKETRQALKSKQFVITFLLLIIVVIAWTLIAILFSIPNIYYDSDGTSFLVGYLLILLGPSLMVIPQASFRSMASELEEGTYETLSLSLLSPSQVVYGKLSVAILQLVIYLSILAPCIALTYLLQGVTLETIVALLLIVSATSIGLSAIAIFLASLSKTRMLQVLMSVVMIGLQLIAVVILFPIIFEILSQKTLGTAWIATGLGLGYLLGYGWLFLRCASSAIGTPSDNHATPIRKAVFALGMAIPMCGGFLLVFNAGTTGPDMGVIACFIGNIAFIHWGIAGMCIMGESGVITQRARRSLPDSLPARLFLTWFNPGAGPGYIFVVLGFVGPLLPLLLVPWLGQWTSNRQFGVSLNAMVYCAALAAYLALYLGSVRLILLLFFRRYRSSRILLSILLTFFLLVSSFVASTSLSLVANEYRDLEFDWYCFINPVWTLGTLFPSFIFSGQANPVLATAENFLAWLWLMGTGGFMFLLNAVFAARDVMLTRIEAPPRVLEEKQRKPLPVETNEP